jgi:hypothetical protein
MREWRRAAIFIDDYRRSTGFDDPREGLGPRPEGGESAMAHDKATRAIRSYKAERARGRDIDR